MSTSEPHRSAGQDRRPSSGTPQAELRQVYAEGHAEGHAAGYAVGYAESYVKGVEDALADRGLDAEREVPLDDGEEYRDG